MNALADAIKQLEESEGVVEVDGKVLLRQQFQRRLKFFKKIIGTHFNSDFCHIFRFLFKF